MGKIYYMIDLASQMMTLIRLLPLMVGNYVERNDKHWECFLQLWDICNMVCAFEVTTGDGLAGGSIPRRVFYIVRCSNDTKATLFSAPSSADFGVSV